MPARPQIIIDVITKSVAILFDGKMIALQGPFENRVQATSAATDECANRGGLTHHRHPSPEQNGLIYCCFHVGSKSADRQQFQAAPRRPLSRTFLFVVVFRLSGAKDFENATKSENKGKRKRRIIASAPEPLSV